MSWLIIIGVKIISLKSYISSLFNVPFETIQDYAAMDAVCTYLLFEKFENALVKNDRLYGVYRDILIPACRFLTDIPDHGVPYDKERLQTSAVLMAC